MTERPTHHDLRNKLIQSRADGMSYRWLPVQCKDADKTPLGVTLSRSLVEEIGFFPSKVATLMRVFNTKDAVQPGFLTWFYMNAVKIVFFTPWLLAQAILWQGWRTIKALYRVTTGSLTYLDKEKVLPKNK